MDPELLRLLLEVLRNQQTTGSADTGGDWPYDDYGLQGTIGGLGATAPDNVGDFSDGSIESLTRSPARNDTSPSTYGGPPPFHPNLPTRPTGSLSPRIAAILQQMQQGVGNDGAGAPMHGLFGNPGPPIERPQPQVTPVAAPVAGTAHPAPRGTPTPDRRRDVSTLPNKPKEKRVPMRAPQAAQHIAAQGRAAFPQRQYSAPAPAPQRMYSAPPPVARNHFLAPTFTSAPSSRAAAQSTLASVLAKLLR